MEMQQYEGGDFFRLYGSDLSYTDYRRNPAGTVGIPAGAGGVWEPMSSSDKIIGGNTLDGAYLVDDTYLVWHATTGSNYAWTGAFPKVVAPGTDPAAVAGFVMRSDAGLREDLAASGGYDLIGTPSGSLKKVLSERLANSGADKKEIIFDLPLLFPDYEAILAANPTWTFIYPGSFDVGDDGRIYIA